MYFTLRTLNISYTIEITNKYTFIQGDSGTGKSYLVDAIENSNNDPLTTIESPLPHYVLGINEIKIPTHLENNIIFIDEDRDILNTRDSSRQLKLSKNFFVIVSREIEPVKDSFPLSIDSFFKLETTDNITKTVKIYHKSVCNIKSHLDYLSETNNVSTKFFN